jgi:hypothetical protein
MSKTELTMKPEVVRPRAMASRYRGSASRHMGNWFVAVLYRSI